MSFARIISFCVFTFYLGGLAIAQEERRISFNHFGGIAFIPGSEKINNSGQAENIFGGYPIAPMGGLGVNYRFTQKLALANNLFFFTTNKSHYSFHNMALRAALKYYPITDKHRLSPFISGGFNINFATINRREYSETVFPDTTSSAVGSGISVSRIDYNYEKLNLSFVPMPGVSAGAGASYKLTPKISLFAEYNYNYNLANLSSLMKEHYFNNKSNLAFHFASAGVTIKLLKPRKQLLATLTRDAWDGDLTVTVKGSLVYKNPNKKNLDKPETVEVNDIKDTVIAVLPPTTNGEFEYKNLRADDYKFYLQKNNRKILRADLQIVHDNRKVNIFEDYPALELIDDYESSNIISRDNNFSVVLREGFQHEVDVTVIANNVIGKVTPFSPDSLCRNMLVLLKNKQDSVLAVTKPDNNCGYHFDDIDPGQYKVVFVRDTMPGNVSFSYEFTENPPVIQRQFNTEEDEAYYELYASAEVYEEYDAMDINQLILFDIVDQVYAVGDTSSPLASGTTTGKLEGNSGGEKNGQLSVLSGNNPVMNNNKSEDPNTEKIDSGSFTNPDKTSNNNSVEGDKKTGLTENNNPDKIINSDNSGKNMNATDVNEEIEVEEGKFYPLEQLRSGYTYSPEGQVKQPNGYGVQVAAFKSVENLKKYLVKQKKSAKEPVYIQVLDANENSYHVKIYRVVLGEHPDIDSAKEAEKKLKADGYETVIRKHKVQHSRGK